MSSRTGTKVAVVGAGCAGLVAGLSASERGAEVTIFDSGDERDVGGNALFSGGLFLFAHDGANDLEPLLAEGFGPIEAAAYSKSAYVDVLIQMSQGRADDALVDVLVGDSFGALQWLRDQGVSFQPASRVYGTFERDGVTVIPPGPALEAVGAGPGLVAALSRELERREIAITYGTQVVDFAVEDGRVVGVVDTQGATHSCDAVVLTPGGFEASEELRRRYLGDEWGGVKVRGTRHNTGLPLEAAFRHGATPAGALDACHSISVDASAEAPPRPGVATPARISRGFRFGIVVNADGHRFFDEGADHWTRIYSKMGRAILRQPGSVAYHFFDGKVRDHVLSALPGATYFEADSLAEAARLVGIDPDELVSTVDEFNRSVDVETPLDFDRLDGRSAAGLNPPKSNWADTLDTPPFLVFPAACGITFTHGGLRIDRDGRVLGQDGQVAVKGLYAAGEITGGLFFGNYPGGSSLVRSTVFGLRASHAAVADFAADASF